MLVITGPVGVGKSTVGYEAGKLLTEAGLAYAFVDVDALSESHPRPPDDPFNARMAYRNLAAVWANFAAAGAERLVLAYVIERREDLQPIRDAITGAEVTLVRLRAPDDVLQSRVAHREAGSGRAWHLYRSVELARIMDEAAVEDHLVETAGRTPIEIAQTVLEAVGWLSPRERA